MGSWGTLCSSHTRPNMTKIDQNVGWIDGPMCLFDPIRPTSVAGLRLWQVVGHLQEGRRGFCKEALGIVDADHADEQGTWRRGKTSWQMDPTRKAHPNGDQACPNQSKPPALGKPNPNLPPLIFPKQSNKKKTKPPALPTTQKTPNGAAPTMW